MLILSNALFSQQIKKKDIELDDIINLLSATGYEFFSFDISEMLNERYNIEFIIKENEAEKEISSSNLNTFSNKTLLTDFSESSQQEYINSGGQFVDSESQAITHAEKISFGIYPAKNDSTKFFQINVPGIGRMSRPLKMKGLSIKDSDEIFFSYHTRPFKIKAFKEDEFIPLILFGSSWYDELYDIFRFCGESEIEPDMSSEILKDLPHYYVLGLKFVKEK